ncbi:MAG: GGDEF domain-containing protein [Proteobacteria bacterium]|nr:GGDEF domain-containing protein [Pseudomonadota bacterium]
MPYQIVHAIGATVYFIFFLLFLWIRRMPRINHGAGWWAAAMLFAVAARLVFLLPLGGGDNRLALTAYAVLNVVEKFCLLAGLVRFFNLPLRLRGFWIAMLAVQALVLAVWVADASPLLRDAGVAAFNAVVLACVAWIACRKRDALDARLLLVTSVASALLALHWASAFLVIDRVPGWFTPAFVMGTLLVLVQYFSLLAAVLLSFQNRLLASESRALDMAFQDPLTGLSNQRYMSTLFENALMLANRPHQLVAVVYIDIDHFKPVNDRAGHRVGDEVLKLMAARLKRATRSTDICARVGGDEFVVICTQLEHEDHVHGIAEKLLREFTMPVEVEGRQYQLGASIGISLYPLHGDSLTELVELADKAMYRMKREGKGGYRMHAP